MMVPMFRSLWLPRGHDVAGDMPSLRTGRG
jgi:hypothetical protein